MNFLSEFKDFKIKSNFLAKILKYFLILELSEIPKNIGKFRENAKNL